MITFARVKGKKGLKIINYKDQSAVISWNVIKGVTEEVLEENIREIISCLSTKTSLVSVMDYMKPYNLVLILKTFFSEEMESYLRHFVVKQFFTFKTTTVNMILSEVFGRNMQQCYMDREPMVQELVKTIETIIDDEYENKFACGDYLKFDSKFDVKYKGYYSLKFKGKKTSISWCYFNNQGLSELKSVKILAEIIVSLKEKLDNNVPLHDYSKRLGPTNLVELMFSFYPEETIPYFKHFAAEFTDRRERITTNKLLRITIDPKIKDSYRFLLKKTTNHHLRAKIEVVVIEEYSRQCILFPQSNFKEMTPNNTTWKYYYVQGPALKCIGYDFSSIAVETIRHEYMLYFRDVLRNRIDPPGTGKYSTTIIGISSLLKINPSIKRFCDIRKTDVRLLKTYLQTSTRSKLDDTPLSVGTMSRIFLYLGDIVAFLTEHYLSLAKKDQRYQRYVPKRNYFRDFRLANVDKMVNNTVSIPDVVMDEINKHKDEIGEIYSLMFDVFNWTGLRAKEVELLEEDCVRYDEEYDFWYIVASSPKTVKAKRKKGLPSKRIVAVPRGIARRIKVQEEHTKPIRDKHKTPYIFIKESAGFGHVLQPPHNVQR